MNDDCFAPARNCPTFVSRPARLLAGAGVLAALGLGIVLAQASSHDAVDRKLAEFERATLLAQRRPADPSVQASVAAHPQRGYHAAQREETEAGCGRGSRQPG